MARAAGGGAVVLLEEMVLAQPFEQEALLDLLEREGVIRKIEALDEVKRLRKTAAKAH